MQLTDSLWWTVYCSALVESVRSTESPPAWSHNIITIVAMSHLWRKLQLAYLYLIEWLLVESQRDEDAAVSSASDVNQCTSPKHTKSVAESLLQVGQLAASDQRPEQTHQIRVHVRLQVIIHVCRLYRIVINVSLITRVRWIWPWNKNLGL